MASPPGAAPNLLLPPLRGDMAVSPLVSLPATQMVLGGESPDVTSASLRASDAELSFPHASWLKVQSSARVHKVDDEFVVDGKEVFCPGLGLRGL